MLDPEAASAIIDPLSIQISKSGCIGSTLPLWRCRSLEVPLCRNPAVFRSYQNGKQASLPCGGPAKRILPRRWAGAPIGITVVGEAGGVMYPLFPKASDNDPCGS